MKVIETLRNDYQKHKLHEVDMDSDPMKQFETWMQEALEANEISDPHAMVLSTVDTLGQPSSRMVLLRVFNENGFGFYTNYASRKAVEIDSNPRAALLFFWESLHRQIRIEGELEKLDGDLADNYFASRPRDSQISAWASPQSAVIPNRESLEENYNRYARRMEDSDVPRPSFWGGYLLRPNVIEFWQGRPGRLHDRLRYRRASEDWKIERLAP